MVLAQRHASTQHVRQACERAIQHLALRRYAEVCRLRKLARAARHRAMPLDRLHLLGKQLLSEAMLLAVSHDQQITVEEAELLRAFCACLHCPVPSLLSANVSI